MNSGSIAPDTTLFEEDWAKILPYCETVQCKRKDVIVKKGDFGDDIYMLVEGEVEIYVSTMFFVSTPVATLRQGDIFGEVGFLLRTPRTGYVVAKTDTTLLKLSRSRFSELTKVDSKLAERFKALLRRIMQQRSFS